MDKKVFERKALNTDKLMALDFETCLDKDNVHIPFMLSYYSASEHGVIVGEEALFKFLKKIFGRKYRQYTFVSHNLEFDFNVMLNLFPHILADYEVEPRYTKSNLIMIKVYKIYKDYYKENNIKDEPYYIGYPSFSQFAIGKNYIDRNEMEKLEVMKDDNNKYELYFKFLDTMNFFKMSLAKLGLALGYPKEKKVSWLGERLPKTEKEWENMKIYCLRDSEICYKAMKMLHDELDGNIGFTIASTSLKYFDNNCRYNLRRIAPNDHINNFYRMGYAGGRTEAFGRGAFENVNCYDVNSLYPFSMIKMPCPHPEIVEFSNDFSKDEMGIFKCIVYDERDYPITFHRGIKLWFITAKKGYETYLSTNEIKFIEEHGGKVDIIRGYKSPIVENYFKPIVDTLYNKRKELKENSNPLELVYKYILNSGYGKYAEINYDYRILSGHGKTKEQLKYLYSLGYKPVGDYLIKTDNIGDYTEHTNYLIASSVTATARLTLQSYLEKLGKDNVYYCDTDSVFTPKKLSTGKELGEMKLEYNIDEFIPIRAKFYAYQIDKEWKFKFKGLPYHYFEDLKNNDIDLYTWLLNQLMNPKENEYIEVDYPKLVRFKESARRNIKPYTQIIATKEFSLLPDGKRKYRKYISNSDLLTDNTLSEPFDATDLDL